VKILIGSPVRTTESWQTEAFTHYLNSLDNLVKPCQTDRLFLLHNSPHLKEIVKEGAILGGAQYIAEVATPEEYKCDEVTHQWESKNLLAVTAMRNFLISTAREMDYDYYFMVDSDLVLHPQTLVKLIEAQKDIVAEAFWTKWTPDDIEAVNAWDGDVYTFFPNRDTRFAQFRQAGLYQVGMTGACVLMNKKVLQSKINYDYIPCVSFWGEDRAFSIRAACAGFEIWLDTHHPPIHLYRESELNKYSENGGYKAAFSI
jgi:hypothetical protein